MKYLVSRGDTSSTHHHVYEHNGAHAGASLSYIEFQAQLLRPVSLEPLDRSQSNLDTSFTRSISSLWEGGERQKMVMSLTHPYLRQIRRGVVHHAFHRQHPLRSMQTPSPATEKPVCRVSHRQSRSVACSVRCQMKSEEKKNK